MKRGREDDTESGNRIRDMLFHVDLLSARKLRKHCLFARQCGQNVRLLYPALPRVSSARICAPHEKDRRLFGE